MRLKIAGVETESIVDGTGIRFVVFTQGCPHHCEGCHNPETHDPKGGHYVDTEFICKLLRQSPIVKGITFSGGEPFLQPEPCRRIARVAHMYGKDVWAYSGWTLEELQAKPEVRGFLEEVDVLVDGKFILAERTLEQAFKGSKNQRIIRLVKGERVEEIDEEQCHDEI